MIRKHSALLASFLVAAASLVVPIKSVAPAVFHLQIVPYGTQNLEDTNFGALTVSMLDQMHSKGLQSPPVYLPFPESLPTFNQVVYDSWRDEVRGELPGAPSMSAPLSELNLAYTGRIPRLSGNLSLKKRISEQPLTQTGPLPCNALVLVNESVRSVRVFDALHETTHYIIDTERTMHAPVVIALTRRANNAPSLDEKWADGTAALYILQNYADTPGNRIFVKRWEDLRDADYVNFIYDTSPTIRAAEQYAAQHPGQKLSVVDSMLQMARIIYDQGLDKPNATNLYAKIEVLQNLRPIAEHYSGSYKIRMKQAIEDTQLNFMNNAAALALPDKAEVAQRAKDIMSARNRSCGLPAP